MLHVAINATSLAPGGGLTGLMGYLKAWRTIQAPLRVTLLASRASVIQAAKKYHPEVFVVPFAVGMRPSTRVLYQSLELGRHLNKIDADVVMTTNFTVAGCRTPQLVHHRNLKHFIHRSPLPHLMRRDVREALRDHLARKAMRTADANVFISNFFRERAEAFVPEAKPRNHVIHNGLDDDVIGRAPLIDDTLREQGRLLSVTTPAKHKDNPTLIHTLQRLLRTAPDVPWHLVIAGGGEWADEISLIERLGVADHVTFKGFLSPQLLDEEYKKASCAVFTSTLESFGNGPLEAMARRCPVVAANTSAMPEVISDAGVLVPAGDASAFAHTIILLELKRELRRKMVAKGVERIRSFTWNKSAQLMFELLALTKAGGRKL